METINNEISAWLKKRDYQLGLLLLSKYSKNKTIVRILSMNPNKSKADKLLYELLKLSGRSNEYLSLSKIIPVENKPAPAVPGKVKAEPKKPVQKKEAKKVIAVAGIKVTFNKLPLIIQEIIKQRGRLYRDREILHEKLTATGEKNTPENIVLRAMLGDKIEHIAQRIDAIYSALEHYEKNKTLPGEDFLNWDINPTKQKTNFPDYSKMNDIDLKNRLTNLRSYLTKDLNKLKYNSVSAKQNEDPMPAGPKRDALEKKVATRKEEIEELTRILENRAGKSKGNKK